MKNGAFNMKMIVGLGNPGSQYANTKHNMGFQVIDRLAKHYDVTLDQHQFEATYGTFKVNGEKIWLVKPMTYMNDSGRAVRMLMSYYQITLPELLVIQDDLDLAIGKLRLRARGSAGGHNGIRSIIAAVGSQDFKRIKIGIDHPQIGTVVDWVLTPFNQDDQITIDATLDKAASATVDWLTNDNFEHTMNKFNR